MMHKNTFFKIVFIFAFLAIFSFSVCFASENKEENQDENIDKQELILVINDCVNEIKNNLKEMDKVLEQLDKTEEYEKYPAIRLNIDTPFFGLGAMVDQKLKIKNEVSTVDVAKGYSIKDITNNMSIKLPDFKVGNIVVSTRDVKFDDNISIEDAKTSILKLVQYISQTKNTNELLNKRINHVFEGYIPKEKSDKMNSLNNKLVEISNNIISKDEDILTITLISNDETSKEIVSKYYDINNRIYNLEKTLDDVLLSKEELESIEKESINLELESLEYLKKVNKEKDKITNELNIEVLLNNTMEALKNKKISLDEYVSKSFTYLEDSLNDQDEINSDEKEKIQQYEITSKYIIDYEQTLLNNLDDKIKYYIPTNTDENINEVKTISDDEKKSLLRDVIKLYNDFVSKENKFYLDNLNYILRDTTYKLSKLPEYTDAKTVKDVKYIYVSLPEEIDDLLDEYNSKSTLQTEALTNSLKDRLLRIVDSNIQVNMEYSKYNLS